MSYTIPTNERAEGDPGVMARRAHMANKLSELEKIAPELPAIDGGVDPRHLALAVLDAIVAAGPGAHRQSTWGDADSSASPCGTTLCAAGWTAWVSPNALTLWSPWSASLFSVVDLADESSEHRVGDWAGAALGLTWAQGERLFMDSTDATALRMLMQLVRDGEVDDNEWAALLGCQFDRTNGPDLMDADRLHAFAAAARVVAENRDELAALRARTA